MGQAVVEFVCFLSEQYFDELHGLGKSKLTLFLSFSNNLLPYVCYLSKKKKKWSFENCVIVHRICPILVRGAVPP